MKGLTKRQRELADYIEGFLENYRYSPSYKNIAEKFGFSSLGSVYNHLRSLKNKGALQSISQGKIVYPKNGVKEIKESLQVPFIGFIITGKPVQMFMESKEIEVSSNLISNLAKTYALSVQGDFLKEEMIANGDILLVEVRENITPGETILGLINGNDIIIKKYYLEGDSIRLLNSWNSLDQILLRQEDILIQGVVIGLLRFFK